MRKALYVNRYIRAFGWLFVGMSCYFTSHSASIEVATFVGVVVFILAFARNVQAHGLLNGSTILILFMGLFHLGIVGPVFLLNTEFPLETTPWLFDAELSYSVAITSLGIAMTQAGSELASKYSFVPFQSDQRRDKNRSTEFVLWTINLFVCATLYMYFGVRYGILFSPRVVYLSLKETGESRLFGLAGELMILSAFIAAAFGSKKRGVLVAIFVLAMLFPMFAFGKRGEFLVTAAALGIVLSKKGVQFPRFAILSVLGTAFASIPVIRYVRGGNTYSTLQVLDPFYEMGIQLRTIYYTVEAVTTNVTDWWYGRSYWDAFMRVLPSIRDIRETIGGSIDESPSHWLTDTFNWDGAGLGYSIFAEPFLNFGLFGVICICFIVGYFMRSAERWGMRSAGALAVYGVTMKSVFWSVRNDFYGVVRPLVWVLLGLLLTRLVVEAVRKSPQRLLGDVEEGRARKPPCSLSTGQNTAKYGAHPDMRSISRSDSG